MANNAFISFSYTPENEKLKNEIGNRLTNFDYINNFSENEDRSNCSIETIWSYLRNKIKRCSLTILLFTDDLCHKTQKLNSNYNFYSSGWIYKELSCSLRDWQDNRINGLIIIDCCKSYSFEKDNYNHVLSNEIIRKNVNNLNGNNFINNIYDNSYKYLNYDPNKSYIVLCKLNDFLNNPKNYIDKAIDNRNNQINFKKFNIEYDLHLN